MRWWQLAGLAYVIILVLFLTAFHRLSKLNTAVDEVMRQWAHFQRWEQELEDSDRAD